MDEGTRENSMARNLVIDAHLSDAETFKLYDNPDGTQVAKFPNEFLAVLIENLYMGSIGTYQEKSNIMRRCRYEAVLEGGVMIIVSSVSKFSVLDLAN
jgi:hypothetical protein